MVTGTIENPTMVTTPEGFIIYRKKIESFVETWMDLETVIQSEVSQKEKNKYRILTHVCGT